MFRDLMEVLVTRRVLSRTRFNERVTIAIITRGEYRRVAAISRFLERYGARPVIFLNIHTAADETASYQRLGTPLVLLANEHQYIEPIVAEVAKHVTTEFVFFLANDEIPNPALLREVAESLVGEPEVRGFGVPRRWLFRDNEQIVIGKTPIIGFDHQWRIFPPREVEFTNELGTPGHHVPPSRKGFEGPGAIYHLDWLLTTLEMRKAKLRHYDSVRPGQWGKEWQYFLPEEVEDKELEPVPQRDRCVLRLVESILRSGASVAATEKPREKWWEFG